MLKPSPFVRFKNVISPFCFLNCQSMTGHVESVTRKQPSRLKSNQMFSRNHLEALVRREPNGDIWTVDGSNVWNKALVRWTRPPWLFQKKKRRKSQIIAKLNFSPSHKKKNIKWKYASPRSSISMESKVKSHREKNPLQNRTRFKGPIYRSSFSTLTTKAALWLPVPKTL